MSEEAKATGVLAEDRILIGVSTCLLGQEVRHDGGHKHDRFLTETLGRWFDFVPVCPEVEIGMGVPREPVRLVRDGEVVRMLGVRSGTDHTDAMTRWARTRVRALARMGLCGYVLKKGSPSCGMERVRVYTTKGMPSRAGRGLFADELLGALPLLPVEEEGRLCDPALRENFIERVFAFRRLERLLSGRWRMGDLVAFHSREKLLLLAHDPGIYRELGRLVAEAKGADRAATAERYRSLFLTALARIARPKRHVNVLQHMLGYFKKSLTAEQRTALAAVVEDYRRGLVPLVVPITLLRHYVDLVGVSYLADQSYLQPHPKELMLRNHV